MYAARERPGNARLRSTLFGRRFFPAVGVVGHRRRHDPALVLVPEGEVHLDEGLLLVLVDVGIAEDLAHEVVLGVALLEDSRPDVQRFRLDPERLGDLLEDLGRRLAETAFYLA